MANYTGRLDDSFNESYSQEASHNSSSNSSRSAKDAFKVLLKDIADQLSADDDKTKLRFFCGDASQDESKKKPLDLLWDMQKKGKLSWKNPENLEVLLRNIDRHDLITDYLERFKEQYPKRELVSCPASLSQVVSQDYRPHPHYHQRSSTPGDAVTPQPPATSLSSHHSYPSLPTKHCSCQQIPLPLKSHCGALSSYCIPEHAASEDPTQSLMVGTKSHWVKNIKHQSSVCPTHNPLTSQNPMLLSHTENEAASVPISGHSSSQFIPSQATVSEAVTTSLHANIPMEKLQDSSDLAFVNMANNNISSCHTRHDSHYTSLVQPPKENSHTHSHAAEPHSRLHEDDVIGPIELESSVGSNLSALPYCSPTADLRNKTHAHSNPLISAYHHQASYATDSLTGTSSAATGEIQLPPAATPHNKYPEALPFSHSVNMSASSAISTPKNEDEQRERRNLSLGIKRRAMSESLPQHEVKVEGGRGRLMSLQANTNLTGKTYSGNHVTTLSSMDIVRYIGNKVGVVMQEFPVHVNISCKCGKPKEVWIKLVPHKEQHLKHVSIEGRLLIPRKCSRHKWLVHFARSYLQVCTVVTRNGGEVCTAAERTFIYPVDTTCGDNLTQLTVSTVIPHEEILYKPACQYLLKVSADIVDEGFIADKTADQFHLEQLQLGNGDTEECETFIEIKRNV